MSHLVTESREVPPFDRISLRGVGHLTVEPGNSPLVRVEADEKLLPHVITQVKNGELVLNLRRPLLQSLQVPNGQIRYSVNTSLLSAIGVSGAGRVSGSLLSVDHFSLSVSGAGRVELAVDTSEIDTHISGAGRIKLVGKAPRQSLSISGAGRYAAQGLTSAWSKVRISGAGRASVRASEKLDVTISGSGLVSYAGAPQVSQRISGVGRVSRLE